jgi:hypothetical protein
MTLCYWRKNDDKLSSLDSQITAISSLLGVAVGFFYGRKNLENNDKPTTTAIENLPNTTNCIDCPSK